MRQNYDKKKRECALFANAHAFHEKQNHDEQRTKTTDSKLAGVGMKESHRKDIE